MDPELGKTALAGNAHHLRPRDAVVPRPRSVQMCVCATALGSFCALSELAWAVSGLRFSEPEISILEHNTLRLFDLGQHANARILSLHREANRITTNAVIAMSLVTQSITAAGALPSNATLAHLNGDATRDFFVINPSQNKARLYYGTTGGGFAPPILFDLPAGASGVAAMTVNQTTRAIAVSHPSTGKVSIFLRLPDGSLQANPSTLTVGGTPLDLVSEDFNANGHPDIIAIDHFANTVRIWHALPSGGFTFAGTSPVGSRPTTISVGDLTSNAKPDVVTSDSNSGSLTVLQNTGNGTFTTLATLGAGVQPGRAVIVDLDQDGRADIAVPLTGEQAIAVFRNEGNGIFTRTVVPLEWRPQSLVAIDIDDDGLPDLVVSSRDNAEIAILRNLVEPPTGTCPGDANGDLYVNLADFGILAVNFGAGVPAWTNGDLNGDGRVDLADFSILAVNFGSVCGEF